MKRRNVYLVSVAGVALVAGVIIATQLAKNNLYGYITEGEYAAIEAPSNYTGAESDGFIPSAPIDGTIQDQINENLTYTLADLETWQLDIFKDTSTLFIDEIKSHTSTVEQVDQRQNDIIEAQMIENVFPSNAIQLFNEWKVENNYYEQFTEADQPQQNQQSNQNQQNNQNQQTQQGQQGQTETSKPTPPVNHDTPSQGNKPQPSTEQQQTQTQPSGGNSMFGPEGSVESGEAFNEGGGEGGYVDTTYAEEFIPIE